MLSVFVQTIAIAGFSEHATHVPTPPGRPNLDANSDDWRGWNFSYQSQFDNFVRYIRNSLAASETHATASETTQAVDK